MSVRIGESLAKAVAKRFEARDLLAESLCRQTILAGKGDIAIQLASAAVVEAYDAGEVLITQNATDTDILFILSGSVIISPNDRDDMIREVHNHVGEMATIDPSVRRSATVRAREPTVVARVPEPAFSAIANSNPFIWRHLAREMAERLRQRVVSVPIRKRIPRIFIASSSEALALANALKAALSGEHCDVNVWTDGIFVPGMTNVEALEDELSKADFAVILLSHDDRVLSRWRLSKAPRDNLILELGMFHGKIGRRRSIMVQPRGAKLKIPTDLLGVTPIKYEGTDMLAVAKQLRAIVGSLGSK
jgi:predicted nucleotide-binding protein